MKRKIVAGICAAALLSGALSGCGETKQSEERLLNPESPVSLTIWHYYNGAQQIAFDEIVSEFNETIGKEQGIYVESFTKGSVADLENAITSAAAGVVGAENLPDIFSSYADTAFSLQENHLLVDLTAYFTTDELNRYVESYLQEGYIGNGRELYLLPVAKSTEIMMINSTDWAPFANATGCSYEDLKTTEGVVSVAQKYYEWTDSLTPEAPGDGKAFYGRDSLSNYFIIGMKQMGDEIFKVSDGAVTFGVDKEKIRRLWDNYYVPMIKGYFAAYGRFRTDDVKTGDILAYTGSSSSTAYFPDGIDDGNGIRTIGYDVLPAPVMDGGDSIKVQQGAGMAVTKSDKPHEYAASVFLKWFTEPENNINFVASASYLPVLKEANNMELFNGIVEKNKISIEPKVFATTQMLLKDLDTAKFYTPHYFESGFSARKVLDYHLADKTSAALAAIAAETESGVSWENAAAPYLEDAVFEEWYQDFCEALNRSGAAKKGSMASQ